MVKKKKSCVCKIRDCADLDEYILKVFKPLVKDQLTDRDYLLVFHEALLRIQTSRMREAMQFVQKGGK